MGHSPADHVEHAEHAAHAAHDDFNKRVTMSIAIVAAVLACVTMLGHRAHNETLRLQGEALELQTQASIISTQAANKWAYYQSKNVFNLESEITVDLLSVLAVREGADKQFESLNKKYKKNVEEYKGKVVSGSDGKEKTEGKLKKIQHEATELDEKAKAIVEKSEEKIKGSHAVHKKAELFDLGELGLQLGVVLCSLAILTKARGFWFVGLVSAVVGAVVSAEGQFGLFLGAGHH